MIAIKERNRLYRPTKLILPILGGAATPESLSETLDSIYATTWQLMREEAIDNIFTATPLWYWLYSKSRVRRETGGGKWIGIQTMYGKNTTVSSLAPGGTVDISETDPFTVAKYDWKYIAGSVIRTLADDTNNRGKSQIYSLIQGKTQNLQLSMRDTLETQAAGDGTGNGGLDLLGIQAIIRVDPTTNPPDPPGNVGGIDAAANSWWRNKARAWNTDNIPVGDSDIAFNLRRVYNDCSIGNDHPSLLLTEVNQYERYEASLVNMLRVVDKDFGDLGFEALRYKGAAITFSPSMPAKQLYMLNERYLEFVIDSAADFSMTDWKAIPNQLDRVAQVVIKGNLVTSNRRMLGVLHSMP